MGGIEPSMYFTDDGTLVAGEGVTPVQSPSLHRVHQSHAVSAQPEHSGGDSLSGYMLHGDTTATAQDELIVGGD